MAKFEGVAWASRQMRYLLVEKQFELLEAEAKVYAVSRSIHYAQFLAFEGIRFYCRKGDSGKLNVVFLNWYHNLERFRQSIAFCLGSDQQHLVPSPEEMEHLFIRRYFQSPEMRAFLEETAENDAQGYLRPFTVDEEQSIGVTFPNQPAIRAVACRYDRYLGEPFCGAVVPNIVRAIGINQTGCLKLAVNYLMSVKAVDLAKRICTEAASALFLDDNVHAPVEERLITEWDSSCCLFAFRDGTVVKIPESELILPSITIQGIVAVLREMGVSVVERNIRYGELIRAVREDELITICSVGTAGILNRCQKLFLVDRTGNTLAVHYEKKDHPLYRILGEARENYWDIYKEKAKLPSGMRLFKYGI